MTDKKVYRAIGLMSGTSLDGIDCALIETDGFRYVKPLAFLSEDYKDDVRAFIKGCLGKSERDNEIGSIEHELTLAHANIVRHLLQSQNLSHEDVDVIGFHGQTLYHNFGKGITFQIGDGALLADETGIDTVNDFRTADVRAGGNGAPLLPLYHRARAYSDEIDRPLAIVNIGGVSNVTWLGERWANILAFDTGPGNALMDDFIFMRTRHRFDKGGKRALMGEPDLKVVQKATSHDFFKRRVPKSLDRDEWAGLLADLSDMSIEDGLATLGALSVESIFRSIVYFPERPKEWLVTGGGRYNDFLMERLRDVLDVPVNPVEHVGWNGDSIEAEGFAYLAVRNLLGRPLSLPSTTGVREPCEGGVLHKASKARAKAV